MQRPFSVVPGLEIFSAATRHCVCSYLMIRTDDRGPTHRRRYCSAAAGAAATITAAAGAAAPQ